MQTPGFTQLLEHATAQTPGTAAAVAPAWTLEIISPNERKRYEWSDLKSLPTEILVSAAPPSSTPAIPVSTPSDGNSSGGNSSGGTPRGGADDKTTTSGSDEKPPTDKS
jgi:hypothetical protein